MEDHSQVLRRQHAGGNVPPAPCAPEREAWSTPVLIELNAAGTENGGAPGGPENATYTS
jgi:hypothetical protein